MRAACSCLGRHGCISVQLSWLWSEQCSGGEEGNTHFFALKHEAGRWNFRFSCWAPKDRERGCQVVFLTGNIGEIRRLSLLMFLESGWRLLLEVEMEQDEVDKGTALPSRDFYFADLLGEMSNSHRGETPGIGCRYTPLWMRIFLWGFSSLSNRGVIAAQIPLSVGGWSSAHRPLQMVTSICMSRPLEWEGSLQEQPWAQNCLYSADAPFYSSSIGFVVH